MATIVYSLCALTSLICAVLLGRAYLQTGARLLMWAAICFAGLAVNNILLFIDLRMIPATDLSAWRTLPALAGVAALVYGLVWDS